MIGNNKIMKDNIKKVNLLETIQDEADKEDENTHSVMSLAKNLGINANPYSSSGKK